MGEQSTLKLTFETNITNKKVGDINGLTEALERLDGLSLPNINKLSTGLSALGAIKISAGLGSSVTNLVTAISKISELENIAKIPQTTADSLSDGFKKIAVAASAFEGATAKIPVGTATIVNAITKLNGAAIMLDDNVGVAMSRGFASIANAVKSFDKESMENVKIPKGLGSEIVGLVNAVKLLDGIPDVSGSSERLNVGFSAIATAVKNFEDTSARIPVTLGKGVLGLVTAVNQIDGVRDISGVANLLNNNFAVIANAVSKFEGLNNVNYAGISKLVSALTSMGNVKVVNNNVIKNAEKLALAINVLDKNVIADTPRLREMGVIVTKLGVSFNNASSGSEKFGGSLKLINIASFVSLARQAISIMRQWGGTAIDMVSSYGELQNSMAFFGQALGEQSRDVGKQVAEWANLGLVDFSGFTNNISILTQMLSGYGIAADTASKMALNLTQLAYDASYSLGENGRDLDKWLTRTQSLIAGQTKVGYYFGMDATTKSLAENFDGLTSSSDKATKAMALYESLLANTTEMQGQFGREINTTYVQMTMLYNQMGTLKKSIGLSLAPMFLVLTQYAMIALKVIAMVLNAVIQLFGGEGFKLIDYSSVVGDVASNMGKASTAAGETAGGLDKANKAAKELKKTISSIDQVFTINDVAKETVANLGGGLGGLGGLGGNVTGYEFLDQAALDVARAQMDKVDKKAREVFESLKKWAPLIAGIGASFLAWKISTGFLKAIDKLSNFKALTIPFKIEWVSIGGISLLSDLKKFKKYFDDFIKNGANFQNSIGMISSGLGILGDVLIIFGNLKLGGALKIMQSVGEIIMAVEDFSKNGINWNNATLAISGLTGLAIGIGVFTGNIKLAGWGLAIQGFTDVIMELGKNWNAIKKGDWSGVDKVMLLIGVLKVLGGLGVALNFIKSAKGLSDVAGTKRAMKATEKTAEAAGDGVSSITKKLKGLAKNLALGLVIILEVAAAALLIVGTIILLGMALKQVGIAWQPVIANGATVSIAMAIGIGFLILVGVAVSALGQVGTSLIVSLALGIAVLALIGVAALLFIAEIWLIGKALEQVGIAWQPVLDNGDNIVKAIAFGTLLLVGVGVATALLGMATTGSGGALPLAIALGTAMLVLLGVATLLFIAEIWLIGKGLEQIGIAWRPVLENGDNIAKAIVLGTALLIGIGVVTALLGVATVASAGALPLAIALGTAMLVLLAAAFVEFVLSLVSVANSLNNDLHPALIPLVDNLPTLTENMGAFVDGMISFAGEFVRYAGANAVAGLAASIDTIIGWFTKDPIQKMIDDTNRQAGKFSTLNSNFATMIPQLTLSVEYMEQYYLLLTALKTMAENASAVGSMASFGNGMVEMSKSLEQAFNTLDKIKTDNVADIVSALESLDLSRFAGIGVNMANEISAGLNGYVFVVVSLGYNIVSAIYAVLSAKGREIGTSIVRDMAFAINGYSFKLSSYGSNLIGALTQHSAGKGTRAGNLISIELSNAINGYGFNFATASNKIRNALSFDSYSLGTNIAASIVNGINGYTVNLQKFINSIKGEMKIPQKSVAFSQAENAHVFARAEAPMSFSAVGGDTDAPTAFSAASMPIDTARVNGSTILATRSLNSSVKSDYSGAKEDRTQEAIYEQTDSIETLLLELLTAVKGNSYTIDYKGVSKRVNEEINKDKNLRNVRA